eukprot:TRINITY_DN39606_c0_g1_i2.p1 TRINITY_DN39606_c0_g1~~TRINITY_DN39606_c0_g1_i2.p1  ORF type:complete len:123 (+),score=2.99 TRINITY_DN39606_c0_g1_i2:224-592(+)
MMGSVVLEPSAATACMLLGGHAVQASTVLVAVPLLVHAGADEDCMSDLAGNSRAPWRWQDAAIRMPFSILPRIAQVRDAARNRQRNDHHDEGRPTRYRTRYWRLRTLVILYQTVKSLTTQGR